MEPRGNRLPCRYYKSENFCEGPLKKSPGKRLRKKTEWIDGCIERLGLKLSSILLQEMKLAFKQVHLYMCRLIQYISISCQFYFLNQIKSEHGDMKLNRSNNSIFLRLKIYWNRQVFDLIHASGIWMKSEKLHHQASSSKF